MKKVLLTLSVLFIIGCSKTDNQTAVTSTDSLASDSTSAIPNPSPSTDSISTSASGTGSMSDSTATSTSGKKDSVK